MDINLDEYELLPINNVFNISSKNEEILYDITLKDDHLFFIKLANSDDMVLAHNCDGSHITAMLVGWFKRFTPKLFEEKRICKLLTPLIIIKNNKGKIIKYFFSTDDFKKWENTNKINSGINVIYLKGLGSWDREDFQQLIDAEGIEKFIVPLSISDKCENTINDWLGADSSPRKNYLREYSFDINKA